VVLVLAGCAPAVNPNDPQGSANNTGVSAAFAAWDAVWQTDDCAKFQTLVRDFVASDRMGIASCDDYSAAVDSGQYVITSREVTRFDLGNVTESTVYPDDVGKELAAVEVTEHYADGRELDLEYRLVRDGSGWIFVDLRDFS